MPLSVAWMTASEGQPLQGVLVVDLTRHLPGPFATRELRRLGARVVRLEAPGGDPLHALAPGWHAWLNAGKESVVCDLKAEPALGRALCGRADVVVEGFRPGVAERLGVGPGDLPGSVVYCSIRGFAAGSWERRVAHDLNYLALAGVLDAEEPALPPVPLADLAAGGLTAVARILAGLLERATTGRGSVHRISMTDESHRLVAFRRGAETVVPRLLTGGLACYDLYRAGDGRRLSVGALEPQFFGRLCELLGVPDLAVRQYDVDAQDDLRARLRRIFATRPADAWMALFGDEDVAVAPVLSVDEVDLGRDALEGVPAPELGDDTERWRDELS